MGILEDANNIVNNVEEEDSWMVIDFKKFKLLVDLITDTPTTLVMEDGRIFKIIRDLEDKC